MFWFGRHFLYFPFVLYFLIFTIFYTILFSSWAFHKYLVVEDWCFELEEQRIIVKMLVLKPYSPEFKLASEAPQFKTSDLRIISELLCVYKAIFFFLSPWKAVVKPIVFWLLFWSFVLGLFLALLCLTAYSMLTLRQKAKRN